MRLELRWVEPAVQQVPLAEVFESEVGTPAWSGASGQLAEQQVLRDPPVFHPAHVPEPAQTSLPQKVDHAAGSCLFDDVLVAHTVLPGNPKESP